MSKAIMMNFLVDKEQKRIRVEREFNAPLNLVWDAWTKSEILDQWWAPKPWKTETKKMDFTEGGRWQYAMVGPDGEKHWCILDYKSIRPNKSFSGLDAFCDEHGVLNETMPRSFWENVFTGTSDSTIVNIEISYEKLSDLEAIVEMGFKEGFTMGLENLDEYLSQQTVGGQ